MVSLWDLVKWAVLGTLSLFYSLLLTIFVVRLFRAIFVPVDEVELIDYINGHNEKETLKEWNERESWGRYKARFDGVLCHP